MVTLTHTYQLHLSTPGMEWMYRMWRMCRISSEEEKRVYQFVEHDITLTVWH